MPSNHILCVIRADDADTVQDIISRAVTDEGMDEDQGELAPPVPVDQSNSAFSIVLAHGCILYMFRL